MAIWKWSEFCRKEIKEEITTSVPSCLPNRSKEGVLDPTDILLRNHLVFTDLECTQKHTNETLDFTRQFCAHVLRRQHIFKESKDFQKIMNGCTKKLLYENELLATGNDFANENN